MVVNNPRNPAEEISMERARKVSPDVKPETKSISRKIRSTRSAHAAQTAKQVIIQKIKEAEKNIIFNDFKGKENELINGYLQRKPRQDVRRSRQDRGILPAKEQSPSEHSKIGDG